MRSPNYCTPTYVVGLNEEIEDDDDDVVFSRTRNKDKNIDYYYY